MQTCMHRLGRGNVRPEGYVSQPRIDDVRLAVPCFEVLVDHGERMVEKLTGDAVRGFDGQILYHSDRTNGICCTTTHKEA